MKENTIMKKRDFQDILYHFYAAIVALATFWIYVKTLAPTVSFFDSGELISAVHSLGVAHPPGYPLYVLLGWFFSKLPISNAAYRLNLMSAFFASLAVLMAYYITYIIVSQRSRKSKSEIRNPKGIYTPLPPSRGDSVHPDPERMLFPVVSMIAALAFAFSITHWQHAVIAEVYSLNAFLCGLIVWLLLKWHYHNSSPKFWFLYLTALIFGLGFGNHQTISLLAFAACFLVLITVPRIILRVKTVLLILLALLLGLSIYVFVPIRAAQNPPINWGNAVTLRQFRWLVTREGYNNVPQGHALRTLWNDLVGEEHPPQGENTPLRPPQEENTPLRPPQGGNTPRPGGEGEKEGNAGVYHTIRYSLFLKQLLSFNPLEEFGYFGIVLALLGFVYSLIFHRVIGFTLLIAVLSMVLLTVIISDPPEENIFLGEEFHTPSYLLIAVWIGMGAMAIVQAVLWVASGSRNLQYALVFVLAGFFLALPGIQMWKNLELVDRRRNYVAYDYATNILDSLKPNAILFTWGDSGAFPLWYMQIVEEKRPDVSLIHVPHLGTDWFVELLPQDFFISADPFYKYKGNIFPMIEEIVRKNVNSRPIYFDYSSAHSISPPYPLLPHGIIYKVEIPGDRLDEEVWDDYRFRGILDDTLIALDPDVRRTFLMYGSARVELGNYYLDLGELEKAAAEFNAAVEFDPALGDGIVRMLQFRDKMLGGHVPNAPDATQNMTIVPRSQPN